MQWREFASSSSSLPLNQVSSLNACPFLGFFVLKTFFWGGGWVGFSFPFFFFFFTSWGHFRSFSIVEIFEARVFVMRVFYLLSPHSSFSSSSDPTPTSTSNPTSISTSPTNIHCRCVWMNYVKESLSSGLTRPTSLFHFLAHSFYTAHTYTSFQWTSTLGNGNAFRTHASYMTCRSEPILQDQLSEPYNHIKVDFVSRVRQHIVKDLRLEAKSAFDAGLLVISQKSGLSYSFRLLILLSCTIFLVVYQ